MKHGGWSVLVWGCISARGVGDIVRIDGIINAENYRQVLIHNAINSGKHLIGSFIFQHDNNPKHTANAVKSYLEWKTADKTLTVNDWPPQSPDLNIIDTVWDHLDRERNKRQPKSKEELWEVLKKAWYNISENYFRKLQGSLQKRVQDVLSAKGGHTKYWFLPVEAIFFTCLFWKTADTELWKNNAECSFLVILSSNFKGDFSSVVTWLHYVSKRNSHSYDNLCQKQKIFSVRRKASTYTVFELL